MSSAALLVQPDRSRLSDPEILWRQLMQLAGRDLGLDQWGSAVNHVSYGSDTEYAHTIDNQGAGGHLNIPNEVQVKSDGTGTTIRALTTTSLTVTTLNATTANVTTLNATTAGITTGNVTTLTVSGVSTHNGDVVLGNAAGDAITVNGTPTFNAVTTFLNSVFATGASFVVGDSTGDSFAVNATSTFNAPATIVPSSATDASLILKGGATSGQVSLGATNAATPDLIVKNHGGTQTARMLNSGLLIVGTPTAALGTAGAGDVQCNDVWLTATGSTTNFRRLIAAGDAFQVSGNADSGTHLTIDAAGVVTIKALTVDTGPSAFTGVVTLPVADPPTADGQATAGSLVKAFGYVTAGVGPTLGQNYNVASVTRNLAGDYTVAIDRDFSAATYAVIATVQDNGANLIARINGQAAGSFDIHFRDTVGVLTDPDAFSFLCLGTLT